jgi:hypothetical protein
MVDIDYIWVLQKNGLWSFVGDLAHCPKSTSATAAVRQANNTSRVAKWSSDKLHLDELGELDGKRTSNKNRNLVKCLSKRGFMLGAPITYIKGVRLPKKYVVSNMVASLSLDGQMSYALNSLDF